MADEAQKAVPVTKYEIARLDLAKGDTLVFKTPAFLLPETKQVLARQLMETFRGHQVLILDGGTSIEVLREPNGEA
jgi:hypothetical protein